MFSVRVDRRHRVRRCLSSHQDHRIDQCRVVTLELLKRTDRNTTQHKLAQTSSGCLLQHFTRKTHFRPEWEWACAAVWCILWGFPHCIVVMFCYDVEHWPLRQYFIFILDNLPWDCHSCDCWCFTRICSSPFMSICRVNELLQVVPIIYPREEGGGLWSSQIQLYYWWACCNNRQNLKAGTLN